MIISLENISRYYNGEQVLKNISLTIEDNERIGLIGINGCGKSTLLKIIAGVDVPDNQPEPFTPKIYRNKEAGIGFLAQDSGLNRECSVIDEMKGVFRELLDIAERLEELRDNNLTEQYAEEYSQKSAYFETNDGYLIDVKINKILNGMGFPTDTHDRIISTLSGGEKTRLALAKLLLENPALLILDEPTNHLDFDTVMWLEEYLSEYKGALLIVSHDRYFLDKLVTSVCEIERGVLRRFKGNYTAFVGQKQEYVTRQLKEYEAQAEEIAKLQDYVARNIVRASTSNMAKSRVKKLESMELIEKPVLSEKSAKIKLTYDREPPKELLTVENVRLTVGADSTAVTLIDNLSFDIRRGEKMAIVGANGSGKTSLLKVIQNKLPHTKGNIEWGENVRISYFEQENSRLNPNDTVMNAVHKLYPRMTELEVRSLLGSVRITGEDVYKKVGVISGGERAKLRFAIMMLERGNVLILDEPTNHLDISTREVLEDALCEYTGTIIYVSHDRYLLNKLSSRILEITDMGVRSFSGFDEYVNNRRIPVGSDAHIAPKTTNTYKNKEQRVNEAKKRTRIKELEADMQNCEALLNELQNDMADPVISADYQLMQEKYIMYEETKKRLAELDNEWLLLSE
ncbi:MAG: ABC-F family ATP-binding cassette domain-containing protein [Oscillospiraceae bacterium]|nr:ABC-F family ATP-binding cassette domain-containing protein [Oscillospiraceae bacterium]